MIRFLHAADIHLDSPLVGLSAYQDAPADMLRNATRDAFTRLIDEAIAEAVDFMVIAGDLYDGTWRDFNTGLFFVRQMGRLKKAGIPAYVLFGNHDAESEMTKKLELPDNVFRFDTRRAITHRLPQLQVALHGRSFKEAATTENLALSYPDPVPGWLNIGVLHTALEGHAAHANYAPCSIAELEAKGYAYWALGHVHEYRVWHGTSTIVFPGNLQGRNIREVGPRGAVLVTADGPEICTVERLLIDVLRWHALQVDVSGADTLADAVRLVGRELETLADNHSPQLPVAVRVTLTGASPAHGELFGLEHQLRAEVLACSATVGTERLWIEKVVIDTCAANAPAALAARSDALADLQALLSKAATDEPFLTDLQAHLQLLLAKLPIELLKAVPLLDAIRAGGPQDLIRGTTPGLLAHLAAVGVAPE